MAEREMKQFKVYPGGDGTICVSQEQYEEEDNIISIHPDQIEPLVKWLNEVRDELKKA